MARQRKGRAINGVLLLDKPVGLSSNQAIQQVKKIYRAQKVGHAGTLDPFAEGLLPILFGEATKFGRFLLDADKSYQVELAFGQETDTDDATGKVIREAYVPNLSKRDWDNVLKHFQGQQLQKPPLYSALKVGGERAYSLARKGIQPEMTSRLITINHIVLLNYKNNRAILKINCSKGTYIRALVRDIGRFVNSAAYAISLRRDSVGKLQDHYFSLAKLINLSNDFSALDNLLLPLEICTSNLPKVFIPKEKIKFFCHGNDIELFEKFEEGEYAFYDQDKLLGIGLIHNNRAYPKRLCTLIESKNE